MEGKMLIGLDDRLDDLLRAVRGDEDAFNRFAEAERLGVYLRQGRIYPSAIGHTHTKPLGKRVAFSQSSTVIGEKFAGEKFALIDSDLADSR
jgi:hypothetical protein